MAEPLTKSQADEVRKIIHGEIKLLLQTEGVRTFRELALDTIVSGSADEYLEQIAREQAHRVLARQVARALQDPDVKGKSALGYLLGLARRSKRR